MYDVHLRSASSGATYTQATFSQRSFAVSAGTGRAVRTQNTSDPQNSYRSARTLITYNLAYNFGHGSECPDERSALRHFSTGYEDTRCLVHVFWVRSVR